MSQQYNQPATTDQPTVQQVLERQETRDRLYERHAQLEQRVIAQHADIEKLQREIHRLKNQVDALTQVVNRKL